ncbi:MAG: hypothetical protein U0264_03000 [Candidatus Kapaibacterium sp.]
MKHILTRVVLMGISAFCFLSIGCDKLNSLTEINVPITVTFNPTVTNAVMPHAATPECTDLTSNSKFNDNKDKVKSASISELTFQVMTYEGTPASSVAKYDNITYKLKFDPSYGDNTEYLLGSFSNVSVATLMSAPQSISVTDAALNAAVNQIKSRPKFCVYATYTLNGTTGTIKSMTSEMKLTFQLKVDGASAI